MRRVLRPAPLPVVAGPYFRCPPALRSAASATAEAAAAAMLSRSRFLSRAFSRSLSAFQKVWYGRAGAPAGEKLAGRRTGGLGTGAWCPGQAGDQGHRDSEAAVWAAQSRCRPRGRLAESSGPSPSRDGRRPVPCWTPLSAPAEEPP